MKEIRKTSIFAESRLIDYNWNLERLAKETPVYADRIKDPVDGVLHTAAATTHIVTGFIDSTVGDIVRLLQGRNKLPLQPYSGDMPRLKLDASEAVGSLTGVFRTKGLSLLSLPVIAAKSLGDAAADGVDLFTNIHRPTSSAQYN